MLRIGLLLAGNGALDGSDPLQVAAWRIAVARHEHLLLACAPDVSQHDVVGPQGVVAGESRHVVAESMRLTGGVIERVDAVRPNEIDALVVPGGLGAVKTLCSAGVEANVTVHEGARRLATGLLERGGVLAGVDEGALWLGFALDGRALALAADDRDATTRTIERSGHRPVRDEDVVRDGRVLTRWMPAGGDPAAVFRATEDLLAAIATAFDA